MGKPDFKGGQEKSRVKTRKNWHFSRGNQKELFQFCPGRMEAPPLHILNQVILYFILFKMSQKMSKNPIIFTFLQHFPKFAPAPLQNFGVGPKFDHIPFCVSSLFFPKVIEEKPLGSWLDPPPPPW